MDTSTCITPKNKSRRPPGAEHIGTPLFIPPTPFLQTLGYGTGKTIRLQFSLKLRNTQFILKKGVEVYRIDRSPLCGAIRSPWAIKRMIRRNFDDSQKIVYEDRITEEASVLR